MDNKQKDKTNADRILRIIDIAKEHFGPDEVKFVGVKYEDGIGWIAKLKMHTFSSISSIGDSDTDALKRLKKTLKSAKYRYENV